MGTSGNISNTRLPGSCSSTANCERSGPSDLTVSAMALKDVRGNGSLSYPKTVSYSIMPSSTTHHPKIQICGIHIMKCAVFSFLVNVLLQVNYIIIDRHPDFEDSKVCEAADHTKSIVRHVVMSTGNPYPYPLNPSPRVRVLLGDAPLHPTFPPIILCQLCTSLLIVANSRRSTLTAPIAGSNGHVT